MARLEEEAAPSRERKEELIAELADLHGWLDGAGLWHTISGRKRWISPAFDDA